MLDRVTGKRFACSRMHGNFLLLRTKKACPLKWLELILAGILTALLKAPYIRCAQSLKTLMYGEVLSILQKLHAPGSCHALAWLQSRLKTTFYGTIN